jgi:hypothetical protein
VLQCATGVPVGKNVNFSTGPSVCWIVARACTSAKNSTTISLSEARAWFPFQRAGTRQNEGEDYNNVFSKSAFSSAVCLSSAEIPCSSHRHRPPSIRRFLIPIISSFALGRRDVFDCPFFCIHNVQWYFESLLKGVVSIWPRKFNTCYHVGSA